MKNLFYTLGTICFAVYLITMFPGFFQVIAFLAIAASLLAGAIYTIFKIYSFSQSSRIGKGLFDIAGQIFVKVMISTAYALIFSIVSSLVLMIKGSGKFEDNFTLSFMCISAIFTLISLFDVQYKKAFITIKVETDIVSSESNASN